jgi:hypothetical protein
VVYLKGGSKDTLTVCENFEQFKWACTEHPPRFQVRKCRRQRGGCYKSKCPRLHPPATERE